MALFGGTNAFLGLDIGTSSLKLVELVDRKKRQELATYAEAEVPNLLVAPARGQEEQVIDQTARLISRMIEKADVSADTVVAALPTSIVFSTVLQLPLIPDNEMDKAVRFAARDVVPADLEDMVIGWSRADQLPHMATSGEEGRKKGQPPATDSAQLAEAIADERIETQETSGEGSGKKTTADFSSTTQPQPIFLTAAPKSIVDRYNKVIQKVGLHLFALEVETFPLVRSLFHEGEKTGLIIDIGDKATTYHIIDHGTPYVSNYLESGGFQITQAIAQKAGVSHEEAEQLKAQHGMAAQAPAEIRSAVQEVAVSQLRHAQRLLDSYERRHNRQITQSIFIGGGAKLKGLTQYWQEQTGHTTKIGNPWVGLSYPEQLEPSLQKLGSTYGVGVGLALRGFTDTNGS